MRGYTLPKWLVAVLLLAAGAGAAVGPVMAARLTGRVNITASQAISVRTVPSGPLPLLQNPAQMVNITDPDPSHGLIAGAPGILVLTPSIANWNSYTGVYNLSVGGPLIPIPASARSFVSVNDTGTDFTVAVDLLPTSSKFDIAIPLYNSANSQQLAELTLDIPDGVMVDLEQIKLNTGTNPPIHGTNMASIGRTSANTWEVRLQPNQGTYYDFVGINSSGNYLAAPASGIIIHVALANGTPPGFYAIRGKLQAENV